MEHILRFWCKNKNFLYHLFGEQILLEKEIDIKRPEAILLEDMEKVVYNHDNPIGFIKNFDNFIYDTFRKTSYSLYDDLRHLLDLEVLVRNTYDLPSFEIPVPGSDRPIRIQQGCKTMKILSKMAKAFDIPGFEEFRIAHSMVLNQKRFKGTLCLSIHPLDYMTMSDNSCDWESCMSWQSGGEYRLGTVEMMNSPYIIVAYLKAEKDFNLFHDGEATWNNKRWRELFVVTPEMLFAIKGYPYTDNILRDTIFEWLLELMQHNYPQYEFFPEKYHVKNNNTILIQGKNKHISLHFHAMYNDIYSKHPAYFSDQILKHDSEIYHLTLSGETECMICGADWSDDYSDWDTELLICPDCSGVKKCSECGEYISFEDMVELADGTYMCQWCAERYAERCDYCEDIYSEGSVTQVRVRHLGRFEGNSINLCCDCYNCTGIKDIIGEIIRDRRGSFSLSYVPVVDTTNFTNEGYRLFDFSEDEILEMKAELIKDQLSG